MASQYVASNTGTLSSVKPSKVKLLRAERNAAAVVGLQVASQVRCNATPTRRTANYQPNSWDYHSFQHQWSNIDRMDKVHRIQIDILKEKARHLLYNETGLVAKLELTDALRHLGLAHHFHEEIKNILGSIPIKDACTSLAEDLHASALLFRLLRENGFQISHDIFSAFKDDNGHFKESICKDPKGMLSLYEASHLAFEAEETLEDARILTTVQLKKLQNYSQIHRALELPLHWRIPRFDVKWYIEKYEEEENVDPIIVQLAKLDFNMVQGLHGKELQRLAMWWTNLGVAEELNFARDRLVECFAFAAGVLSEPKLGNSREEITKVCNLITKLDDLYDVYGSLDELTLFTDAINKWDFNATEGFPEYLKTCYSIVFCTINESADDIRSRHGINVLSYLKKAWADMLNSFLVEAKWQSTGYVPTLEEYLENGWISVSGHVLLTHIFCLSRQTAETIQYLDTYPNFFKSSSIIFRLCNDLATSAAEIKRGDAPSSIVCYMHQNGVTEEIAREEIKRLIQETWKILNKEVADSGPFSKYLTDAAINLARISHCMYQSGDGIGDPDVEKKNQIKSTFFEPILVDEDNIDTMDMPYKW